MNSANFQRRIQRYGWDKAATLYEQSWQDQLKPAQKRLLEMADFQPGETVLDIACGTGLVTFPAAEAVGENGKVIATDISQSMIDLAGTAAADRQISNTTFIRMGGEDLDFPDNSFDAVICALGLLYFRDPAKSLEEMFRVLKPGGRAVAAVWGERKNCGWADIFPIVDNRVESDVCPMFFNLGNQDTLKLIYQNAGFEGICYERLQTLLHYTDEDDACGAAFAGGPVALAYSRFEEETRQSAHAEYIDSISQYRNGSGYYIPGEFVVVSGCKN